MLYAFGSVLIGSLTFTIAKKEETGHADKAPVRRVSENDVKANLTKFIEDGRSCRLCNMKWPSHCTAQSFDFRVCDRTTLETDRACMHHFGILFWCGSQIPRSPYSRSVCPNLKEGAEAMKRLITKQYQCTLNKFVFAMPEEARLGIPQLQKDLIAGEQHCKGFPFAKALDVAVPSPRKNGFASCCAATCSVGTFLQHRGSITGSRRSAFGQNWQTTIYTKYKSA